MDNYISNSTKNGTRERRDRSTRIHITGLGQKMPETDDSCHDLLSNSDNKTDLIKLFAEYLKSDEVRKMFHVPVFSQRRKKLTKLIKMVGEKYFPVITRKLTTD